MKTSEKMLEIIKRARERNNPFSQTNTISDKSLETIHSKKADTKAKCFWIGFLRGLIASEDIIQEELEPLVIHTSELLSLFHNDDAYELLTEISVEWEDVLAEAEGLVENILEFRQYIFLLMISIIHKRLWQIVFECFDKDNSVPLKKQNQY